MTDRHHNDERTVRCPVDGCDAERLARGIHLHVRQTSGDGHGPSGDVPDHVSLENLETVGAQEVTMDYPEERETEEAVRLCPYCSIPFQGTNGVLIHLGQVAGRKNHPSDAAEDHIEEDFPRVEVDDQGNITSVADDIVDYDQPDDEDGGITKRRVYRLIADLVADGKANTAHRVRRQLLGTDDAVAADREELAHPGLFEAIVTQGRSDRTASGVTTALEGDSVMVACRGESAFYSAGEVREMADRLELTATTERWRDDEVKDFIKFLRQSADVLDGSRSEQHLHEEFNHWG